jgi:hypothetical protein
MATLSLVVDGRCHELIQLDVDADTPPQPFDFPPGL